MIDTQDAIKIVCDEIKEMLLEKNKCYGDSAIKPVRIFSKLDTIEQINVRIDDKLSRLINGKEYAGDDTELDLIGYLILKRVYKQLKGPSKQNPGSIRWVDNNDLPQLLKPH
jgi:hypothetical protein